MKHAAFNIFLFCLLLAYIVLSVQMCNFRQEVNRTIYIAEQETVTEAI